MGSASVNQASCPSGTHNKASCSILRGSKRGSTIATIWALWGAALWSGAAELGKLEQWRISGHKKEPQVLASARTQKARFFTREKKKRCFLRVCATVNRSVSSWRDRYWLPNVVGPQWDLQLPQDFRGFLHSSAELLKRNRESTEIDVEISLCKFYLFSGEFIGSILIVL